MKKDIFYGIERDFLKNKYYVIIFFFVTLEELGRMFCMKMFSVSFNILKVLVFLFLMYWFKVFSVCFVGKGDGSKGLGCLGIKGFE